MSIFSGKCDLADHIAGLGGWYDRQGNPVNFGEAAVLYSDMLKDFEAFKEATGGVIYQHKEVKIKEWFGDEEYQFIREHCAGFDFTKVESEVKDKRFTGGIRKDVSYEFIYYGKQYDFAGMKKKRIWIEVPVKFNHLLELLPYYPYLVSMATRSHVVVSSESYVDELRDDMIINCGHDSSMFSNYKSKLAEAYLEVVVNYYNYKLVERMKTVQINLSDLKFNGSEYLLELDDEIDYMHDVSFSWYDAAVSTHWSGPVVVGNKTVAISKVDVEEFLAEDIADGRLAIQYVAKPVDGFPVVVK